MKIKYIKILNIGILISGLLLTACNTTHKEKVGSPIFTKGAKAPSQFFTGNVYVKGLIENDTVFTTAGGEVFFEAGARSNWHLHQSGQILIVTAGVGYHQIKGEPIEVIHKGDVVKCPPHVDHWHGASKDASMSHIYLVPNTENGIVEWGDVVTNDEYLKIEEN